MCKKGGWFLKQSIVMVLSVEVSFVFLSVLAGAVGIACCYCRFNHSKLCNVSLNNLSNIISCWLHLFWFSVVDYGIDVGSICVCDFVVDYVVLFGVLVLLYLGLSFYSDCVVCCPRFFYSSVDYLGVFALNSCFMISINAMKWHLPALFFLCWFRW